ncbi:MAG TPA: GNAT family N-acetyltransferase [Solirubrobacteraceae bacterium]
MQIEFRAMDATRPPASALLAAMVDEMNELYGAPPPRATAADFAAPHGTFLVGFEDDEPVCGGGLKRLPDGAAEIKRMYVVPAARRRGLARALLGALEDAARARGYAVVRLDTGARQPHAQALYEASGYAPIGNFNANPMAAFWGEKRL